MIGVAASPADLEMAAEFFELFKTAWEPVVSGRKYDAILSTDGRVEGLEANLVLIYGSTAHSCDRDAGIEVAQMKAVEVNWAGSTFPIFGAVALFGVGGAADVTVQANGVPYACTFSTRGRRRVGYDLFREIRHLLTVGQPASDAQTPTLELHIALLRHWLVHSQIPFVEILPRPAGHDFICCLTHDIDFFGVRRHFDRTLVGFVVRASFGTVVDLARGRRSAADAARNLKALCALPLVFLGLVRDFWQPFEDYAQVEDPKHSTFFLVPFRDRPGIAPGGAVDPRRTVRYQVSDIPEDVRAAAHRGSELGIHGIDAWRDADAGRAERQELASITPTTTGGGVRIHWLYFSAESARHLEAAGFDYDSTWGYNDAVGYRAGTTQVFRLPGTEQLMELPLSIMDSALFSSHRMALLPAQALEECRSMIAQARRFGGTLVINWHCRSLAPERLWRQPYQELLAEVGRGRTWFTTAGAAVDWFRWRRSIQLSEEVSCTAIRVNVSVPPSASPGGVIRVHRPGPAGTEVQDIVFDAGMSCHVDVWAGKSAAVV